MVVGFRVCFHYYEMGAGESSVAPHSPLDDLGTPLWYGLNICLEA